MPSIHAYQSMDKARSMGAFAGDEQTAELWDLSKRELIEVALRLGALNAGNCDSVEAGVKAVNDELAALRRAGIV